jgi:hypothetical protein
MSALETPIFINAKDRVSFLRRQVDLLRRQGYSNLHIIDTGSTFPDMLAYEETVGLPIYHCEPESNPHLALWNCGILEKSGKAGCAFVYTDCDILPDCDPDWLQNLYGVLDRHADFPKAGLGLRIDDLPDHYPRKDAVISWEAQFWQRSVEHLLFEADIDTTLALYRPDSAWTMKALRTGGNFVARHLPWYSNPAELSPDEAYYFAHMASGAIEI